MVKITPTMKIIKAARMGTSLGKTNKKLSET
jgi:hypothetical protein